MKNYIILAILLIIFGAIAFELLTNNLLSW
jgi:hypothetical protein